MNSFIESIKKANDFSKQAIHQANLQTMDRVNQNRKDLKFVVGSKVLLSTKNLSVPPGSVKKFATKYIGPFTVIDVFAGGNAYKLDLPVHYQRLHPVFHISLLKPYRVPVEEDTKSSLEFVVPPAEKVERILAQLFPLTPTTA